MTMPAARNAACWLAIDDCLTPSNRSAAQFQISKTRPFVVVSSRDSSRLPIMDGAMRPLWRLTLFEQFAARPGSAPA
jgi:hypothetical protein